MIKLDGLDSCIIGTCLRCGQEDVLLYSVEKVICVLIERDGMAWSAAQEFFDVNIAGLWVGDGTPAFLESYVEGHGEIHCEDVVESPHNRRSGDTDKLEWLDIQRDLHGNVGGVVDLETPA